MVVNWTNITSPGALLAVPNTNTGGSFWSVVVWMVWVVLLLALLPFGIEVALLATAFFGIIAGMFLVNAGLIAWENVLFFVGELIFIILYIVWSTRKDQ